MTFHTNVWRVKNADFPHKNGPECDDDASRIRINVFSRNPSISGSQQFVLSFALTRNYRVWGYVYVPVSDVVFADGTGERLVTD